MTKNEIGRANKQRRQDIKRMWIRTYIGNKATKKIERAKTTERECGSENANVCEALVV